MRGSLSWSRLQLSVRPWLLVSLDPWDLACLLEAPCLSLLLDLEVCLDEVLPSLDLGPLSLAEGWQALVAGAA